MATNKVNASIKISSFLAFLAFMVADSQVHPLKETKLTLFMQDFFGGPKATDFFVAGIPGKEWGFFKFGTVLVSDILVTQGIKLHSKRIARAQGTFTTCSLDGINAQTQLSLLFTDGKYNASTLELQGLYNQVAAINEIPVVSGTGKFRFVRGFATFETIRYDASNSYDVSRCNITVEPY